MNYPKIHLAKNENGMVSLIVTMVIMVVLSITVIGFAQLMRREQRQVLDRQLNTQAFYAAESGVNDAAAKLKTDPTYSTKDDCSKWTKDGNTNYVDDTNHLISYSCLMIDPNPTTLEYTNIGTDQSQIIPIDVSDVDSSPLKELHISWQDTSLTDDMSECNSGTFVPVPSFSAAGAWPTNCPGILRIDLVRIPISGNFDRNWLIDNTATAFLYPTQDGGSASITPVIPDLGYGFKNQGRIIAVNCSNWGALEYENQCKASFLNLDSTTYKYYLRIKSIYKPSVVSIAAKAVDGVLMNFHGAQAIVDSTGKANDVLKRIQVRVSAFVVNGYYPEYDIDSLGSICKRYSYAPAAPPDSVYLHPDDPTTGYDPACLTKN